MRHDPLHGERGVPEPGITVRRGFAAASTPLHPRTSCLLLTGLCLFPCALVASAEGGSRDPAPLIPVPGVPQYGFEHDVPVEFQPDRDSHLTLNHRWHRGPGDTSLRWDWDHAGGAFEIRRPGAFPRPADLARPLLGTGIPRLLCERVPVFSAWMFCEARLDGMLDIAILGQGDVLRQFFVSLNFSGWKEIRLPHGAGFARPADTIRIRAPDGVRSGTLYFDLLSPWSDVLRWREQPRRELPWPTPSSPDVLRGTGAGG